MKFCKLSAFIPLLIFLACSGEGRDDLNYEEWGAYWFQGKAEISSFDLVQYRYGEPRNGEMVLVYVTEDFSEKKQVKLDKPERAGKDAITVLKLNMTKTFITGIYPYSMMLSAFTPVFKPEYSLKVTATSQEWCGHTFTQLNRKGRQYTGRLFSYFETEGDSEFRVAAMPEEDLWNLIRFGPEQLPLGELKLIPGLFEQRFSHILPAAQTAEIRMTVIDANLQEVSVEYKDYNRALKIRFDRKFPYRIQSFEEIRTTHDGVDEITYGSRKATIQTDYWNRNGISDENLRRQLRLSP